MKRKYPISFFVLGILQNLIRYALIGVIGFVILIIGLFGIDICFKIGIIILIVYFLLCIIEQFFIRSASLKNSNNPEFNEFMDCLFGVNDQEENTVPRRQRIINLVEEKIKSQINDKNE